MSAILIYRPRGFNKPTAVSDWLICAVWVESNGFFCQYEPDWQRYRVLLPNEAWTTLLSLKFSSLEIVPVCQ